MESEQKQLGLSSPGKRLSSRPSCSVPRSLSLTHSLSLSHSLTLTLSLSLSLSLSLDSQVQDPRMLMEEQARSGARSRPTALGPLHRTNIQYHLLVLYIVKSLSDVSAEDFRD